MLLLLLFGTMLSLLLFDFSIIKNRWILLISFLKKMDQFNGYRTSFTVNKKILDQRKFLKLLTKYNGKLYRKLINLCVIEKKP